jgi:hypothetical protein
MGTVLVDSTGGRVLDVLFGGWVLAYFRAKCPNFRKRCPNLPCHCLGGGGGGVGFVPMYMRITSSGGGGSLGGSRCGIIFQRVTRVVYGSPNSEISSTSLVNAGVCGKVIVHRLSANHIPSIGIDGGAMERPAYSFPASRNMVPKSAPYPIVSNNPVGYRRSTLTFSSLMSAVSCFFWASVKRRAANFAYISAVLAFALAISTCALSESAFASILYRSNSSLEEASSIRVNLTTAQVAAPAISAQNPAMMRNTTIAFSQPWSDKPNTRLTFFEKIAVGAIAFLLVAFVVLGVAAIWDLCRRTP